MLYPLFPINFKGKINVSSSDFEERKTVSRTILS